MLKNLTYLVALAEEKHFARAAEVCQVAQPTLSIGIRKLERDLSARLVIRGSRFNGLTAEGELALQWARRILRHYKGMLLDLDGDPSQPAIAVDQQASKHGRGRTGEKAVGPSAGDAGRSI